MGSEPADPQTIMLYEHIGKCSFYVQHKKLRHLFGYTLESLLSFLLFLLRLSFSVLI